ncbi:hypothetical protein J6590_017181 [Homalodisca vitripennis]|nr:hypothetical protein J6590_017181 [Homalodisca vitripennis]
MNMPKFLFPSINDIGFVASLQKDIELPVCFFSVESGFLPKCVSSGSNRIHLAADQDEPTLRAAILYHNHIKYNLAMAAASPEEGRENNMDDTNKAGCSYGGKLTLTIAVPELPRQWWAALRSQHSVLSRVSRALATLKSPGNPQGPWKRATRPTCFHFCFDGAHYTLLCKFS